MIKYNTWYTFECQRTKELWIACVEHTMPSIKFEPVHIEYGKMLMIDAEPYQRLVISYRTNCYNEGHKYLNGGPVIHITLQQMKLALNSTLSFKINDNQKVIMEKFIEKHNRSRKCPVNKQRKRIAACGGIAQYSIKITLSSIVNVATIQCECGAKEYLGDV